LQSLETITSVFEETRTLGQRFGELTPAGLVVLLNGDLGAGKTCFAQGVALGLGVSAETPVTSPTYTLLNIHLGRLTLYHFDLYRLSRVDDLTDLGYDEFAEGDGVTLVEWADRMTDTLTASLSVTIERIAEEHRLFRFKAFDNLGRELLEQLSRRCHTQRIPA